MSIAAFVAALDDGEKRVTLYPDETPPPIVRMARSMLDADGVDVTQRAPGGSLADVAVVHDAATGRRLATSPLRAISESVLLVNSDLYVTGTRPLEAVETPAVLRHLDHVAFDVRGKQTMLLIELSRHVESLALSAGDGELHAGFQTLGRVDDERGTRRAYEALIDAGVDVHVYGVPDVVPEVLDGATVHAHDADELERSWFVLATAVPEAGGTTVSDDGGAAVPDDGTGPTPDIGTAGLLATLADDGWRGGWTYDGETVRRAVQYVTETYPATSTPGTGRRSG